MKGVERERVSLRRLRLRWGHNRLLLSLVIVVAGGFCVWRAVDPPVAIVERVPSTVSLDRPAELFAQQLTRAYLTYDSQQPQQRDAALGVFDGGAGILTRGYQAPSTGSRSVRWSAVEQAFAVPQGTRYIVAADTRPDGPIYLSLTVRRDQDGALGIVGSPAIVGPPVSVPAQDDPTGRDVDDPDAVRVVTRALRNYLAGSGEDLAADLSPQAVVSLPVSPLMLERVTQLGWEEGAFRSVLATLTASSVRGEQLQLTYELALEQRQGRWFVAGIHNNPTGQ